MSEDEGNWARTLLEITSWLAMIGIVGYLVTQVGFPPSPEGVYGCNNDELVIDSECRPISEVADEVHRTLLMLDEEVGTYGADLVVSRTVLESERQYWEVNGYLKDQGLVTCYSTGGWMKECKAVNTTDLERKTETQGGGSE